MAHSDVANHWLLDPAVDFLNHGSFGACPRPVLAAQQALRERLEAEPLRFMDRELEPLLDEARRELSAFVGAAPEGLAFVPNATTGIATVFGSLPLGPGDELLTTTHAYAAVRNGLARRAEATGARLVRAEVPFPIADPQQVVDAVLAAVSPRTKLAVIDHVTSPTALVFPIERIVAALAERGVETIVDGAHAPGQLDLDVSAIGAAYYVGNCHKWLCAPKGSAFLAVRADRRDRLAPLVTSNGASSKRTDRSRFHLEFDWVGTLDPTAYLAVPAAIAFLGGLYPGGWPELRRRHHELAMDAQGLIAEALGIERPAPEAMIAAMAALPLPPDPDPLPTRAPWFTATQQRLFERGIQVPVFPFPAWPQRLVRVTAFAYNRRAQYERLAGLLAEEAARVQV